MATSVGSLQLESSIKPWRKFEIKRRTRAGYEADWQDFSKYVTAWPTISFKTDILKPFSYRIGSADMSFRADEKQFSSESFSGSLFSGFFTRHRSLVRISTGLEDGDGVQHPTATPTIFYGLIGKDINDGITDVRVPIDSIAIVLDNFDSDQIAPSVVGVALTAKEIIETIRDYQDGNGNVVLDPFLSSGAWLLTSTGRTYTIPTSTALQGKSAFQLIEELAMAENHMFYIDRLSNVVFTDRTPTGTSVYDFNGTGQGIRQTNIEEIESYNEGINKVYTKFILELNNSTTVATQESYNIGDDSSSWLYGQREYRFSNKYVNSATAGSITSELLAYFVEPREELTLRTKYIAPNLDIKDIVNVRHFGESGGSGAIWDIDIWDNFLWSDERGGILINNKLFFITGIEINTNSYFTRYFLKEKT